MDELLPYVTGVLLNLRMLMQNNKDSMAWCVSSGPFY